MQMPKFEWRFDLSNLVTLIAALVMLGMYVQARDSAIEHLQKADSMAAESLKDLTLQTMNARIDLADTRARLIAVEARLSELERRLH